MKIRFLAIAQREVDDAVRWYDDQIAGLGQEFLDELDRAVRRAAAWPTSCPRSNMECVAACWHVFRMD